VKKPLPTLISNPNKRIWIGAINGIYKVFFLAKSLTGNILWFSSLVVIMYMLPSQMLMHRDQTAIIERIAMQQ
jgi:hypothetical protein